MKKSVAELRKFGWVMAGAFGVFGLFFLWREKPYAGPVLYVAAGFLVAGLVAPRMLAPIEWAWMKFAHFLGAIVTRVVLTLTFYLVITPVGLLLRAIGKDPLVLRKDAAQKSYWVQVPPDGPCGRPEKPY